MKFKKLNKGAYDKFGHIYQKTRDENHPNRVYNDYVEVPAMIKAVGDIKGKKLLDIGCGAGVHLKEYVRKGANCEGLDVSENMLKLARKNCPSVEFKLGSIDKLPYKASSFDIVTASLCIDYVDNLDKVFKEVNRVLKKNGLFYYSNTSPIASARERFEKDKFKGNALGFIVDKKTGKRYDLGDAYSEGLVKWEMYGVPGMIMRTFKKTFRSQLKALVKTGFTLIDLIDCKPVPKFKKYAPVEYKTFTRFPIFSIYVSKKVRTD